MRVQICVKGHLNPSWQPWLEGLHITHQGDGTSRLSGILQDQAALYGVLLTIRRLGLSLLELTTSEVLPHSQTGE
ncbi:MAG TPA: hypothetical protein VGN34_09475 [Ktedonobacteraceae bacterium]|jgi:hypothetical protein